MAYHMIYHIHYHPTCQSAMVLPSHSYRDTKKIQIEVNR